MGKKRRHSNPEPSELPYKKTAVDFSVNSHAQDSVFNSDSADSSSSSNISSSSSSHRRRKRKKEKKKRKHKESRQADKHKKKHKKNKRKKHCSEKHKDAVGPLPSVTEDMAPVPNNKEKSIAVTSAVTPARQVRAPMTKAEWEKQQSIIRRVHDPTTGRDRLVKGDGEIVEEIVTKDRHKEINKQATLGDGLFYQSQAQFFS